MRCRNEYLNCKILICDIIVIANVNTDGFWFLLSNHRISLQNFTITYIIWDVNYYKLLQTKQIRTKIIFPIFEEPSSDDTSEKNKLGHHLAIN